MENLMAKWKTTMDAQKNRSKQRNIPTDLPETEYTEPEYIKVTTQRIIDVIAKDQDPPSCSLYLVTKFQQVCEIIQKVINKERNSKNLEAKTDTTQVFSEFESKINEIEREKVHFI
jgi:hypothetical protein